MGLSEKIKVPFLKSPSNTKSKKNYKFFKEKTGNLDDLVRLHKKKKKDEPEPNIKVIKISGDKKEPKKEPKKQPKKEPKKEPNQKENSIPKKKLKQTPNLKKKNIKRSKQIKKSDITIKKKKSKEKPNHKFTKKSRGTKKKPKRISNNTKGRRISLKYQPKNKGKKINDVLEQIDKMDTKSMKNELQNYGIEIKSNKNKLIKDMLLLSKTGNIRIHRE